MAPWRWPPLLPLLPRSPPGQPIGLHGPESAPWWPIWTPTPWWVADAVRCTPDLQFERLLGGERPCWPPGSPPRATGSPRATGHPASLLADHRGGLGRTGQTHLGDRSAAGGLPSTEPPCARVACRAKGGRDHRCRPLDPRAETPCWPDRSTSPSRPPRSAVSGSRPPRPDTTRWPPPGASMPAGRSATGPGPTGRSASGARTPPNGGRPCWPGSFPWPTACAGPGGRQPPRRPDRSRPALEPESAVRADALFCWSPAGRTSRGHGHRTTWP